MRYSKNVSFNILHMITFN